MRKFSFIIVALWISIVITPYVYAQKLKIGYNQDLVPSFYWTEQNDNKGIDAEIIQELFRRSGLTYEMRFTPWARVMGEAKIGSIDAACPGFKTPEREAFAIYLNKPLNYATFSIFVRRGEEFPFSNLEDLHGKTVGINRGYSISPDINNPKHQGKIILEEATSAELNLRKLVGKRIDAYAGNRDAALFIAEKSEMADKIAVLPHPITEPRPVYLMISKAAKIENKAEVIEKLNKSLDEMWGDGTIERIISKYINLKSYMNK